MFTSFFFYTFAYMEDYTVNRKQFHFLLVQFLAENRLTKRWYKESIDFKKKDYNRRNTYLKYNMSEDDDFSTHLYKCIDLYIGETGDFYERSIYGFFRYIPSGGCDFGTSWVDFWKYYSDKWENKYYNVKHEYD